MSERRRQLIKGGSTLALGEIIVQACGFLRNLLVARLIAPDQFGIAAALAMSVSLIEMLSEFGAARFLTRAHDEDGEDVLRAAHAISTIRGVVGALLLVAIAPALAGLLDMAEHTWAFRMLGIAPLVRGFTHLHIWLAQRELRYKAFVTTQVLPQLVTLAAAYPLAAMLQDFRALLWLILANAVLAVGVSHLVANRAYRLTFDGARMRQILSFGLPLLGDGLLMFAVLHGERIVLANAFGATLLGAYSAALLLAATPAAFLGRIALNLGVPQFAALRGRPADRNAQITHGVWMLTAPALGLAMLFGAAGDDLIAIVFGSDYAVSPALAAWLGFGLSLRIVRTMPIVVSIAEGYTLAPMLANALRAASVALGWFAALAGNQPWVVLACGAGGEVAALTAHILLNRSRLGTTLLGPVVSLLAVAAGLATAWWVGNATPVAEIDPLPRLAVGLTVGTVAGAATLLSHAESRNLLAGLLSGVRSRISTVP